MRTRATTKMIAVGCLAAACGALRAADLPPSDTLQEITVTAQKRTESVQNVPLSITTFTPTTLQQEAINTFFDYGTKVPNLAFGYTGDGVGTARSIAIRGVSGDNTTGFYIDDVPLPDSIDPRVLDTDHIEVLRGPQGTLYGARSMGGTVRIITEQPQLKDFDGRVHLGISDTWNTTQPNYVGDAVVNIPLVENRVALRVSGFFDYEAGFLKRSYCTDPQTTAYNLNATPTCTPLSVNTHPSLVTVVDNVAALQTAGGAAALTIEPTDGLTITPRAMYQAASYNGLPMTDVLTDTANGYGYPVPSPLTPVPLPPLVPSNFTQARIFNIQEGGYDHWGLYSLTIKWKTSVGELVSATAYFNRKVQETEDSSDFDYAALLAGYQALPAPGIEIKDYDEFVQEVRFASTLAGNLQFVVGGFYSDLHGSVPFASYYPGNYATGYGNILTNVFHSCLPPPAPPGTYLCPSPTDPDLISAQNYYTSSRQPAVFGELSYQFTPALKGTVGLRWNQVTTTAGGTISGSVSQSNIDYVKGVGVIVDQNVTTTETSTTPKVQLDYHVNPDVMVYGLAAKGFRPGGLVPSVPAALCANQLPAGVTVDQTRQFQSDSLWNYELGLKSAWLDHRLTVNAAAFYIDWSNIQQWILLNCGFQYLANTGGATNKGGELEVDARPVEPLVLSLGVGYVDAKITSVKPGSDSPITVGQPVLEVPDWTGNASATWTQPISSSRQLVATVDYSYVGSSFSANNISASNFTTRERPSYTLLNARIAFRSGQGPWELALVGKNLENTHANLADNRSITAEVPGRPRLVVNQPRTIGLEYLWRF